MADLAHSVEDVRVLRGRTDWGAIWAGVFTFLGIWAVFGALGMVIFASTANPRAGGMSNVGMGIWAIVLTVVAMYIAGRETGRLAGVDNRHVGLIHGMVMFGLAIAGIAILTTLGGALLSRTASPNVNSPYALAIFADLGWFGFLALLLGWLAAMFGASSGVAQKRAPVREMRPAA